MRKRRGKRRGEGSREGGGGGKGEWELVRTIQHRVNKVLPYGGGG